MSASQTATVKLHDCFGISQEGYDGRRNDGYASTRNERYDYLQNQHISRDEVCEQTPMPAMSGLACTVRLESARQVSADIYGQRISLVKQIEGDRNVVERLGCIHRLDKFSSGTRLRFCSHAAPIDACSGRRPLVSAAVHGPIDSQLLLENTLGSTKIALS